MRCVHVFDGGSLMYKIAWPTQPLTYDDLCGIYTRYVHNFSLPVVVFDGYHGPSTKDETH